MNDSETKRLSRLIALLTLLQTKRLFTATELASRFTVSVRTIYRDMKTLEQAGVPLSTQEGKGFCLIEGYRLPPVMFTQQEANAVITAQELIALNKDASLINDYQTAVAKIKAVLRETTRDKANLLSSRLKIYPSGSGQADQTSNLLSTLQTALTNYTLVQVHYESSPTRQTDRIIEPFALLRSTEENWLVVAWCRLRKAFRIFRLDRIQTITVLTERFEPHNLTLKQYFDSLKE